MRSRATNFAFAHAASVMSFPSRSLSPSVSGLRGSGLSAGGDLIRSTLAVDGSLWTLTSPVDDRVLATFLLSGENVTLDGSTYGPGESWPLAFDYNVTTPGGMFRIEEFLTLTNEGIARPRIVLPGACM
jgi:hypothetical protein